LNKKDKNNNEEVETGGDILKNEDKLEKEAETNSNEVR